MYPYSSLQQLFRRSTSGVYGIKTIAGSLVNVFCDVDIAEGPWTVVQRRTQGDVDFYRNWTDYKNGFGNLHGDFWIGNDMLHLLTSTSRILRIELEAWEGLKGFAQYSTFQVASEYDGYTLSVASFSGNIYDAMASHDGLSFSTPDVDNDATDNYNSAELHHGAWWYRGCGYSSLNGGYKAGRDYPPLKKTLMMIR